MPCTRCQKEDNGVAKGDNLANQEAEEAAKGTQCFWYLL